MKRKNRISILLSSILVVLSSSVVFCSGIFSKDSRLEELSEYTANVVKNNSEVSKYGGLLVEPTNPKNDKLNNTYNEYLNLYGVFKAQKPTFAGVVNADKEHTVFAKEISENTNYSFLYADNGFGTPEYKGHYKQEFYNLELMFKGSHLNKSGYSFFYISQSQADVLLDSEKLEHNEENYKSLLGKYVTLTMDGVEYKWWIEDIYLETNYFYSALKDLLGDFFFGAFKYPDSFKKQSLYFMSDKPFQNKYFIKYSLDLYSQDKYDYKFLNGNFTKKFDNSKLDLLSGGNNSIAIILAVGAMVLYIGLLTLLIKDFIRNKNIFYFALSFIEFSFIYGILFLFYKISKISILFSSYSLTRFLLGFGVFTLLFICVGISMIFPKEISKGSKIEVLNI